MRFLLLSLLILSTAAFGGTRVTPNVGTNMSILTSSNTSYLSGSTLWKPGDTATSYIERLGRHTPVGVTPSRGVPISRIGNAVKGVIRTTPLALAGSAMFEVLLGGIDWVMTDGTLTKRSGDLAPVDTASIYFTVVGKSGNHSSAYAAATSFVSAIGYTCCTYEFVGLGTPAPSSVGYQIPFYYTQTYKSNGATSQHTHYIDQHHTECTNGEWSASAYGCVSTGRVPVTDADIDSLDISGRDANFYDGLMRDACNASASPSRCFDDLVEHRKLEGPATVEGPKTKTTSTQTNADGSTSTVEKETRTQYDIEYGDDHYVYTPKTTTETKVDGQTTETTTEQEDTAEDSEQKPEEEPVSEIAGLNCEASIACSGDAIQCAIASTQKDTKCLLQDSLDFPTQQNEITSLFQGDQYALDEEEIEIPSFINQGARFLPSTCPAPISLALSGKTLQLDTQPFCTFANDLSFLIVAFSALAAALYVGRAFGGE